MRERAKTKDKKAKRRTKSDVMEVGGSGCSWVETLEESRAQSKALSNVRVHGQDCRVSTCHPLGLAAQAIIKPLGGATACHYSKNTDTHTRIHTLTHAHHPPRMHPSINCEVRSTTVAKECGAQAQLQNPKQQIDLF